MNDNKAPEVKELPDSELDVVVGGQGDYNAQNDRSMMSVAEGAAGSTAEILRPLKGKINAVNDTNTEVDRAASQKEIGASIQQIDDNALLTFNGKPLNNGARTCKGEGSKN